MSNTKKTFHLTITNNETGETIQELDFNALIGAANTTDNRTCEIIISSCNSVQLATTICGAESALEKLYDDDPRLHLITKLMVCKEEENEEEKGE